ncbi:MAG TPA: alpha/beta fold hydrolase [Stenotrophomonas sp.]|nr:alpha/beta fold hydrolase [Stenotrophomonas sp.]
MSHYSLATTALGNGSGVLLAHGAGSTVNESYGPLLDTLAARHRVVGADYPGSGASPAVEGPLSLDELADSLVAAADADGLQRFAVVGYSLGGLVALRVAERHPQRVSALVLTATSGTPPTSTRLLAGAIQALHADPAARPALARVMTALALSSQTLESLPAEQLEAMIGGLAQGLPAGTGQQFGIGSAPGLRANLASISVPTLVVVTTQDRIMPPEAQRALAAGIAGAETVEIPSGHLIGMEAGEPWRDAVSGFLARVGAK